MQKLLFCLLVIVVGSVAKAQVYSPTCSGKINLTAKSCGATIEIGNKIIAICQGPTSLAFSTLMSQCLADRSVGLSINSTNRAAYIKLRDQCGGQLGFVNSFCGTTFVVGLYGRPVNQGGFKSMCHDPNSVTDPLMKDIRDFCQIRDR